MADQELLELVLALVTAGGRTRRIARSLMSRFGTFAGVLHASAADLMATRGVTEAGVVALKAVVAAAQHLLRKTVIDNPRIRDWEDLMKYVAARLHAARVEIMLVIFFDGCSRVICDEEFGRGTINHVVAYPREIIRRCLELDAVSIVLVHNHPNSVLEPSLCDINVTDQIVEAARTMDITVLDHLIVGNGECFSFYAEGLLEGGPRRRQTSRPQA
jgi:DNA repair protein RadC